MDPVTHIALGAAIGGSVIGKEKGKQGFWWGACVGLMPDLDIIPGLFLDIKAKLAYHRGFTHSLLFCVIAVPLLILAARRIHRNDNISSGKWGLLFFLTLSTHMLLDCFTAYGTQVFYPFSDIRIAFDSISVIDPLFTIPLVAASILCYYFIKSQEKRRRVLYGGLVLSTCYLFFTLVNKQIVMSKFTEALARDGYSYSRIFSSPTMFNNILWYSVAEGENNYYAGYYSYLDKRKKIQFKVVEKNRDIIKVITDEKLSRLLQRFSRGYYTIARNEKEILFCDLRYGVIPDEKGAIIPVYSFTVSREDDHYSVKNNFKKFNWKSFYVYIKRISGEPFWQ